MLIGKKKGFTIVEILVCLAILSAIIGVIITMMSRGASNVQKGSFTALAANQAAWICSVIRNDIARSDFSNIEFEGGEERIWKGDSTFRVKLEGGTAAYSIENRGKYKVFVRKFSPSSDGTAFAAAEQKKQTFGDELMTAMSVALTGDNSFVITISMDEPNKRDDGENHEFNWSTTIYPPQANANDNFWVSTLEEAANQDSSEN